MCKLKHDNITYLDYGEIKGHGPESSQINKREEAVRKTLLTTQRALQKLIFVIKVQSSVSFVSQQ